MAWSIPTPEIRCTAWYSSSRRRAQATFSRCLKDSLLGRHLRELYDPAPRYREGQSVELEYYSIEDVRDFVTFIVGVLPGVLDRFLEGRIANAIDTTPAHLQPAWLRRLPPPSV